LNNNDITLAIYVFFILIVLFISYKYASYMIKNTGLFLAYSFIASMINLTLLIIGILVWLFYFWGVNEFLFFGSAYLGIALIVVSEFVLIITLLIKRKSMLNNWNKNKGNDI